MKTCGYCGRENEDAAVVCRECGMSEFPVPAAGKAQASHAEAMTVAEPEPPTPDVAPDQEAAICPFCLFPNLPDREWCKQCGAPFNTSAMGTFESAWAVGFMWRGVVRGRPKWWVLFVIWILFSPLFCLGAFTVLGGVVILNPIVTLVGAVQIAISFSMLYQVTRNYTTLPKLKLDE